MCTIVDLMMGDTIILPRLQLHFYIRVPSCVIFSITYVQYAYKILEGGVRSLLAVSMEKAFECTVYSKRFTTSFNLVVYHKSRSGEEPYKCFVCDKAFNQSVSVR